MKDRAAELESALGQWVEEASAEAGPHPDPADLAAYLGGELADDRADAVRRHLVVCAECRELLLEVERFAPSPPDADAEAAWEAMAARLADTPALSGAPAARVVPFVRPPASKPASRWLPWAVAASFLLVAAGLGSWALTLRRAVLDLGGPQVNAPIVDLYPGSARRSGAAGGGAVELPSGVRLFTLILNLPGPSEHDSYRAEIVDGGGRVVWSGGGLAANPYGSLTLILPRSLLAGAGRGSEEYSVRLYGGAGDGELIDVYSLALE